MILIPDQNLLKHPEPCIGSTRHHHKREITTAASGRESINFTSCLEADVAPGGSDTVGIEFSVHYVVRSRTLAPIRRSQGIPNILYTLQVLVKMYPPTFAQIPHSGRVHNGQI